MRAIRKLLHWIWVGLDGLRTGEARDISTGGSQRWAPRPASTASVSWL